MYRKQQYVGDISIGLLRCLDFDIKGEIWRNKLPLFPQSEEKVSCVQRATFKTLLLDKKYAFLRDVYGYVTGPG